MTDGSSSNRHVDATAATLHYALGKRHMKSWMTAPVTASTPAPASAPAPASVASPPPRKRGRPRKYPLPDIDPPAQHVTAHATQHAVQPAVQPAVQSAVQPTVEPTVQPTNRPTTQSAVQSTVQPASPPSFPPLDRLPPSNSASPQLANTLKHHHPTPRHGRSHVTVFPSPTPSEEDTLPQQHPTPLQDLSSPRPTSARGQPSNAQTVSPELVHLGPQWGYPPLFRNDPPLQSQHGQIQQTVQAQQTSQATQPTPYTTHQSAHHQLQSSPMPPSQRRASSSGQWYTRQDCQLALDAFKSSHSVPTAYAHDKERLLVLEQAVDTEDWAYLTLHQYYCLLYHSPGSLPLRLQHNRNLATAYDLLLTVLADNAQISPPTLDFFCNFPLPVNQIARCWPLKYQQAEHNFLMFVDCSPSAGPLRLVSERRRVPPTPRELAHCSINSKTFQSLLLRSILRTIWARYPQGPAKRYFEDHVMEAWNREFKVFQQRRVSQQLGGHVQADEEWRAWSFTFAQFTGALETALRSQPLLSLAPPHLQQQQPIQQQPLQQQPLQHPQPDVPVFDHVMSRRQQPRSHVSRHSTASRVLPFQRRPQAPTPLLPRPGLIQPQQRVPNPSRFGLHQAHLRSPVLQARGFSSRLYLFWQGFVCKPHRFLSPNMAVEKLTFQFSAKELGFVAKATSSTIGAPDRRLIDAENRKLVRLRCIKWPSDEPLIDAVWAVTETSWIPFAYFTFNGSSLQLRKKLHNGKDLPADLTHLVRQGENTLGVSVMSSSDDNSHRNYLVAIEFLGVLTQSSIRESCLKKRMPAESVVSNIKRKLAPSDADDEIAIVQSSLTINLRDPFSASKICDTPVRSTACLHNECFDLDTFLETRPRKGDVSAADQWRCPICKADARPNKLVVDDFLVGVHQELERRDLLETRAILVDQDGCWQPKPEERDPNGVQDRDTPEPSATPTATRKPSLAHDVIDLDSD